MVVRLRRGRLHGGRSYERRLRALASRLRRVRVVFPGHVTGPRKTAVFSMAHVYVSPRVTRATVSRCSKPCRQDCPSFVGTTTVARDLMRPEFGALVSTRGQLLDALELLLNDEALRRESASRRAGSRRLSGSKTQPRSWPR